MTGLTKRPVRDPRLTSPSQTEEISKRREEFLIRDGDGMLNPLVQKKIDLYWVKKYGMIQTNRAHAGPDARSKRPSSCFRSAAGGGIKSAANIHVGRSERRGAGRDACASARVTRI